MIFYLLELLSSQLESWGLSLTTRQAEIVDLSQIYRDAPDAIMGLIVMHLSTEYGMGGLNVLRLVSKRLMRVVESCATMLTQLSINGPGSFPLALMRCSKIESIACNSLNLRSLEGCPDGLKSLIIRYGGLLQSLEPLRGCIELESLYIYDAGSISDLRPLASCTKLKTLALNSSQISDLSPLSSMVLMEELSILACEPESLQPLSGLMNLQRVDCREIDPSVSLQPLESCTGLTLLKCDENAVGLEELKRKLPGLSLV